MRHHNQNLKFGREIGPRRALLKSLAVSLIERGKIKTTEAKAKALRPFVEKLVTRARRACLAGRPGDLATTRLLISRLGRPGAVAKLVREIAPRYATRPGGYTRVSKLPARGSDASRLAIIEFV